MNRRHRLIAASLAALALVFAQIAAVAHACDLHGKPLGTEVMAHHDGCPGSAGAEEAPRNGNVCAGHCQYGQASVESVPLLPDAGDAIGPAFRVELPDAAMTAGARPEWRFALAAAPPPRAILFGVLRL